MAKVLPQHGCASGDGSQTNSIASTIEMATEYIKSLQKELAEMKSRVVELRPQQVLKGQDC
jgi:hypothetical protein